MSSSKNPNNYLELPPEKTESQGSAASSLYRESQDLEESEEDAVPPSYSEFAPDGRNAWEHDARITGKHCQSSRTLPKRPS